MKILYIAVRTDLDSMKLGKTSAQTSHASNAFTEFEIIQPMEAKKKPNPDAQEWRKESKQGFGTVLTIAVNDLDTMKKVVEAGEALGFPSRLIVDESYPYHVTREIAPLIAPERHTRPPLPAGPNVVCFREEITCAYLFGEKADLEVLLARFNLLPNV